MKDVAELFAKMEATLNVKEKKTCDKCGYEYPVVVEEDMFEGTEKVLSDNCPKCLVKEEDDRFRKVAKEEIRKRNFYKFNRFSLVPHDLKQATFEEYEPQNNTQKQALETVKKFVRDELEKSTLFFQGDTGLGKSHLSYCAHQYFNNERYQSAVFVDMPGLLKMIRETYSGKTSKTQEEIMEAIEKVDLLVLDDIGAEYVKPDANGYESWAADILFQIANARQGKKNIYTTNFTSKHLTQKYGMMSKRIISRLMSNAKVIKVEGDDHRLKGLD